MMSFNMLLCAVVLLLAVSVEASTLGGYDNYNYELSGQALTDLYNSPVYKGEWMIRPLESSSSIISRLSHTGVRVTLADGSQWLVHKGNNYGVSSDSSDTVVTNARGMGPNWRTLWTKNFNGRKTVSDFVKRGGQSYNLLFNCHVASIRNPAIIIVIYCVVIAAFSPAAFYRVFRYFRVFFIPATHVSISGVLTIPTTPSTPPPATPDTVKRRIGSSMC